MVKTLFFQCKGQGFNPWLGNMWVRAHMWCNTEWTRKLWYISTMKYHSAIKKNAFESVLMTWMKLEPIIQSKVRKKNTKTVYQRIYMEFRKMSMITLYARQQEKHRCTEQSFGLCGRRRGWDDLRA